MVILLKHIAVNYIIKVIYLDLHIFLLYAAMGYVSMVFTEDLWFLSGMTTVLLPTRLQQMLWGWVLLCRHRQQNVPCSPKAPSPVSGIHFLLNKMFIPHYSFIYYNIFSNVSNRPCLRSSGRIQLRMNGLQIRLFTNFIFTAENPYNLLLYSMPSDQLHLVRQS